MRVVRSGLGAGYPSYGRMQKKKKKKKIHTSMCCSGAVWVHPFSLLGQWTRRLLISRFRPTRGCMSPSSTGSRHTGHTVRILPQETKLSTSNCVSIVQRVLRDHQSKTPDFFVFFVYLTQPSFIHFIQQKKKKGK